MQVDGTAWMPTDKLRKYAAYDDMIVAVEYLTRFSGKVHPRTQEFHGMLNDIQDAKMMFLSVGL